MAGIALSLIAGTIIRFLLFFSGYEKYIQDRVEISTPLNSWKRVVEGVHMNELNISPYDGDLFHEAPLLLHLYKHLLKLLTIKWMPVFCVLSDVLAAYLLYRTALQFGQDCLVNQKQNIKKYSKESSSLLFKSSDCSQMAVYVALLYLFNPYTLLNCIAMTTTVLENVILAASFMAIVKGFQVSSILLGLLTCISLYPCMLIVPAALSIAHKQNHFSKIVSVTLTALLYIISFMAFMYFNYLLAQDWKFLNATYGFILNVPDLTPNIGLFWYFFTEMFEHFRLLFICTFQINAFLYVIPLTIRFHSEPVLLAYSLCTLITIFKSYPCIGDVGFHLALLPMWKHLQQFLQQSFIVGCFFLATSVLAPILWHLWIYAGSANANFYFGVTLAFGTAQIFLVTDVLFAFTKREFHLLHGLKKEINGKPAKLILE